MSDCVRVLLQLLVWEVQSSFELDSFAGTVVMFSQMSVVVLAGQVLNFTASMPCVGLRRLYMSLIIWEVLQFRYTLS